LLALTLLVFLVSNGRGNAGQSNVPLRDWVSLSEWAKQNDFKLIWLKKDGSLTLTKQAARLAFKVDSLSAEINGVTVWLHDPIALRDGQVCVASLDLLATIRPILFPATNHPGNSIKTICPILLQRWADVTDLGWNETAPQLRTALPGPCLRWQAIC